MKTLYSITKNSTVCEAQRKKTFLKIRLNQWLYQN